MLDIVTAAANATPGLGRYPPFKREVYLFLLRCHNEDNLFTQWYKFICIVLHKVIAIACAALEDFKNEAKQMVLALVDMERAFVPPKHFIRLVQKRLVGHACFMIHLLVMYAFRVFASISYSVLPLLSNGLDISLETNKK